jgi:hypothetical protein
MMRVKLGVVMVTAIALANCSGGLPGGGGGGGGGGLGGECSGDFGADAAAMKLEGFLLASADFIDAAADLENSLKASCVSMGEALGMSGGELGGDLRTVCTAVKSRLDADMQSLRAEASLRIEVVSTPPRCEVSVDAMAQCAGSCEANVDPGEVNVQCEGGELRGGCTGSCTGRCSADVSARCEGACEGRCEGGCNGTCQGVCEGECATRGSDGQCNGRCSGTCRGTCTANCQGSCTGECVVQASGSCSGECRGECSVEFTEPRCTGEVRPPSMSAECQASCDARLEARMECTPGETTVTVTGNVSENLTATLTRVRAAFEAGFGQIMAIKMKLERLGSAGEALVRAGGDVPDAVGQLGLTAASCATRAVGALPRATAQISVSIEVSASFSASAG